MVLKYHVVALPPWLPCLTQDKILPPASQALKALALLIPAGGIPHFLWLSPMFLGP